MAFSETILRLFELQIVMRARESLAEGLPEAVREALKPGYRKCRSLVRALRLRLLTGNGVHCPICDWKGTRFIAGKWRPMSICPQCASDIRHRLLMASFIYVPQFQSASFLLGKDILHFAPERHLQPFFRRVARKYATADLERAGVDLRFDISTMPTVRTESYDLVVACDVLEHVQDDQSALKEIHRVLKPLGTAVLTVPQKDNLRVTLEDPTITTPAGREKAFGEHNHLRIYGADFPLRVASAGFAVDTIGETSFSQSLVRRHVLRPVEYSQHPLATNHRKIFFCRKRPSPEA
ncbi:MAG: class I SAM-dependent methyltransferase [Candidatus Brocadiae bacterium]|nr:class I SAM-dependent methyltransferase [Candidatus Brocadiia bacterium]